MENKHETNTNSDTTTQTYQNISVNLPKDVAEKLQTTLHTLRERKAVVTPEDILNPFLSELSESYLEEQIEKWTPEDYYFEAARQMPELREKIILQAKKALQKTDRAPLNQNQEIKRSKRKPPLEEAPSHL